MNFFAPYRCESIIVYYCFDRARLFWPNAQCHLQGLYKLFLHLMRALCFCIIMISYLVFLLFILSIRNYMIFLVQFGINKCISNFPKITNCTNFVSLWKNLLVFTYFKLHSKSCDYLYLFLVSLITFLFFLFNPIPSFNHSSTCSFIRSSHLFCICLSIHLPAYPPIHPVRGSITHAHVHACILFGSIIRVFSYSCIHVPVC